MEIHGVSAWRFIVSRLLWAAHFPGVFSFQAASGFKLRLYPSCVSVGLWCDRKVYQRDEEELGKHLRLGDTFIDVGANIGALTLAASKIIGPNGLVLSFEPHPRTFKYLSGNIELNKIRNIKAFNVALGERERTIGFTNKRCDDQNEIGGQGVEVQVKTLDACVPDRPVRLLKIDTEGFELPVLQGATEVLKRTEMVYFECRESHFAKHGYKTGDIFHFLKEHGFSVILPAHFDPDHCQNLLAVKANH